MSSKFRRVALFGKYQASAQQRNEAACLALQEIVRVLQAQGCTVLLEEQTALNTGLDGLPVLPLEALGRECDLGLVVGGDGTMLSIGRHMAQHDLPLIGINQGRLGFMTDIPLELMASTLPAMLAGEYVEDRRHLMQARVQRAGQDVFAAEALNDVVVYRGNAGGMVELRVEVNGHFVANQRADGLIVASPTGSTAYALSAGGPIMHPSIAGWVLVPIAPHTLSNRPVVFANDAEIVIEVVSGRGASANFDSQSLARLEQGDRIHVTRASHQVRFLHPQGWTFFDTLRDKLHWNEGVV